MFTVYLLDLHRSISPEAVQLLANGNQYVQDK